MAIDLHDVFERGGKPLINLLDYCVRSVQLDPVFVFLVRHYRNFPSVPRAVALYEIFCSPAAPARLSVPEVLPPLNLRIQAALQPWQASLRLSLELSRNGATPRLLPPKYLFDSIAQHVTKNSTAFRRIRRNYRRRRTPFENLPEGRMSSSQRQFVDHVWEPKLRPRLVMAGFPGMATIA